MRYFVFERQTMLDYLVVIALACTRIVAKLFQSEIDWVATVGHCL
jgi:hypothetical protein